jgi:ferric-dicitrate binding protein FerR (iron transport regulator)
MPVTAPPIDRDTFAALQRDDLSALERIFRDHYPGLIQEAAQVEEARFAPVIVERAFVDAWQRRATFETPRALETFLHDAVHDRAVRERSRHAALHRFEAFEGVRVAPSAAAEPTPVDAAWAQVVAMVQAPPPDTEAAAHVRADVSRHTAAEHAAALAEPRIRMGPLIIIAVLVVIALAALWQVDRAGADAVVTKALSAPDVRVLSSLPGQRGTTTLGDGSRVTLGPTSKLHIPARFGTDLRALRLEGTASFEVAPGEQPFQVRARDASIVATGTAFGVRADSADDVVTVGVREGEVVVKAEDASRTVAAGGAVAVAADGTMRDPSPAALEEALGWVDGQFVVNKRPLREVLPKIARWYGLDLTVNNPALLDRVVTLRAGLASSRDVIPALEKSAGLKFGYEGRKMVLRDTSEAVPEPEKKGARR